MWFQETSALEKGAESILQGYSFLVPGLASYTDRSDARKEFDVTPSQGQTGARIIVENLLTELGLNRGCVPELDLRQIFRTTDFALQRSAYSNSIHSITNSRSAPECNMIGTRARFSCLNELV